MRPDKYSRTTFTPSDQSYGDVRLLDPKDETRVLRTIAAAELQRRADPVPIDHGPLLGPNTNRALLAENAIRRAKSKAAIVRYNNTRRGEPPQIVKRTAYLPNAKRPKGNTKLLGVRSWA